MTLKATSMLSILAIWVASIAAVVAEPKSWWLFVFTFLGTGAVGVSAWRRLGVSRLIAIAGTWAGMALAAGSSDDATWTSILAFLTTGAVVFGTMKRDAWVLGVGIAAAWLGTGLSVAASGPGAAWMCVFAFLTAGAVANSHHESSRGVSALVGWTLETTVAKGKAPVVSWTLSHAGRVVQQSQAALQDGRPLQLQVGEDGPDATRLLASYLHQRPPDVLVLADELREHPGRCDVEATFHASVVVGGR